MLKVKVNQKFDYTIDPEKNTINEKDLSCDIIEVKSGSFHVISNARSYSADVVKADPVTKTFVISVNGNKYTVVVKDKFDELLKSLGMDNLGSGKVNEVKAPMPGLVLEIRVNEGDIVKKGDAIVVLEAMKMENILKSPSDGMVKKINVKKGTAVEKNQVLINFA